VKLSLKLLFISLAVALFFLFLFCVNGNVGFQSKNLNYWVNSPPYSADPMDYDFSIHHSIYRSVLGSLVTNYNKSEIKGVIAESWDNDQNNKVWKFKIRKNLYFSNGDEITPAIVYKSLKRAFYLQTKNGSKDFYSDLEGISKLKNMNDLYDGLSYNDDEVIFKFTSPKPQFLEQISFGLYSIVHPDNYSEKDGQWNSSLDAISSYTYRIKKIEDNSIKLELNPTFGYSIGPKKKFETIVISWSKAFDADIYRGTSLDKNPSNDYEFTGGVKSGIAFIRCHSWKDPQSVCSDLDVRRKLRNKLLLYLKEKGYDVSTSFLPKGVKGLENKEFDLESNLDNSNVSLSFRNFTNKNFEFWQDLNLFFKDKFNTVFKNDLHLKDVFNDLNTDVKKFSVDLASIVTGVLIDQPEEDIKFMIQSNSGIRIPDETGNFKKLVSKETIDVNKINNEIWDQAIIWPVTHFSNGLYYKSFIDISQLNLVQTPIDFTWVGKK
tara:strand:- start:8670 stop:10142 length:1473 start_codon:yes stop_codon:yes gene_type:complete